MYKPVDIEDLGGLTVVFADPDDKDANQFFISLLKNTVHIMCAEEFDLEDEPALTEFLGVLLGGHSRETGERDYILYMYNWYGGASIKAVARPVKAGQKPSTRITIIRTDIGE